MMIVETDSDPGVWFHMPLRGTGAEFAQWMDLQLKASALVHGRKLTWREKRQTKKFLESSAAMLRDRVEAEQAFLFGPMPHRRHRWSSSPSSSSATRNTAPCT